jgi:hypothetical protein
MLGLLKSRLPFLFGDADRDMETRAPDAETGTRAEAETPGQPAPAQGAIMKCSYAKVEGWVAPLEKGGDIPKVDIFYDGDYLATVEASKRPVRQTRSERFDVPPDNRYFSYDFERAVMIARLSFRFAGTEVPLTGSPAEGFAKPWTPPKVSYAELSETPDDGLVPPLDRAECDESALTENQRKWRRDGYLILEKFFPDDMLDAYSAERWRLRPKLQSWSCPVVYMHVPEARALCTHGALSAILEELIGEPMGLHLNLTGWISTERNWHQDDYLNPPFLNSYYLAVWIALDDIPAESGPFEYVPGSHRWPLLRAEKVREFLPLHMRFSSWPTWSQHFVAPACEEEIERRGAKVERFLAKKGDVMIWHGRLLHRGSPPQDKTIPRKALIAHYSSIKRRPDFSEPLRDGEDGGWYFPFDMPLDSN